MSAKAVLNSVKKVGEGKYLLNDEVVCSNLVATDAGVDCDISFDPNVMTEDEAQRLIELFVMEAIENSF